jgi:hypothetical protein
MNFLFKYLNNRKCIYWTAEIYGFGKWIRKYGFYPSFLPLAIYTDHGAGYDENFPYQNSHEINSDAVVMFYHSYLSVEKFKLYSKKPVFTLFSPFVFARKSLKIEKKEESIGTLYFYSHSTPSINDNKSLLDYIKEINLIPKKFHPISICLHYHDINKGVDKQLKNYGFNIVSAGNPTDENFTENFYKIISCYNYAMSNSIGSYTFYCIEMGLPFSLIGEPPKLMNHSDLNINLGEFNSYLKHEMYLQMSDLFSGYNSEISYEQHEIVKNGLGMNFGISRIRMAFILYYSLFAWGLRLENIKRVIKSINSRLK